MSEVTEGINGLNCGKPQKETARTGDAILSDNKWANKIISITIIILWPVTYITEQNTSSSWRYSFFLWTIIFTLSLKEFFQIYSI